MATACWAFIVAKSTPLKTASLLDFSSLRAANIKNHPQVINKSMWTVWGYFSTPALVAKTSGKSIRHRRDSIGRPIQSVAKSACLRPLTFRNPGAMGRIALASGRRRFHDMERPGVSVNW
jgi:hypothetical protein